MGELKLGEEEFLIKRLIMVFEDIFKAARTLHPRQVISLLEGQLSSIIFNLCHFDLVTSVLLIRFLGSLNDSYFNLKIGNLTINELDNASIPEELKSMVIREIPRLNLGYFDEDYVLLFKTFKENTTSISEVIEAVGEKGYEREIVTAISRATDKILLEIKEINSRFFQNILDELTEKKSVEALENSIKRCVREMNTNVFGWP
jgi:hypothetical protein